MCVLSSVQKTVKKSFIWKKSHALGSTNFFVSCYSHFIFVVRLLLPTQNRRSNSTKIDDFLQSLGLYLYISPLQHEHITILSEYFFILSDLKWEKEGNSKLDTKGNNYGNVTVSYHEPSISRESRFSDTSRITREIWDVTALWLIIAYKCMTSKVVENLYKIMCIRLR